MRSGITVVVPGSSGPFGVLGVHTRERRTFTRDDATFLQAVAHVLASRADHERAEAARRESEERFRRLAEQAPDMVYRFRLRPDRAFEYVSPSSNPILGLTPKELYADPDVLLGHAHPDDRPALEWLLSRPGEVSGPVRCRMRRQDGRVVWTEHRVVPIFDSSGRAVAVEGIARDVTDAATAAEALEDQARFARSVLDSLVARTAVVDAGGTVITVNRAWAEAGPEPRGALTCCGIGDDYLAVCDAAAASTPGASEAAAGIRAVLAGAEQQVQVDYRCRAGDGDRWYSLRVSPLSVEGGGAVVAHTDISERKEFEAQLAHQALHDPLTGLPNRALLLDRLARALARSERREGRVCALFLDLDNFKVINDGLGHEAGDAILVAVAGRLRTLVRPGDTVARFGGDEFVVLCEDIADGPEAVTVAERVARALSAPFDLGGGSETVLTVSIGIALAEGPGDQPETLLRDADAAMYRAKERGRARHELFDQEMRDRVMDRLETESALRRALERGELRVVYQPIVALESGDVVGAEALVRWEHPERGLLQPGDFIGVAEETGLIVPLGLWVLEEACRQAVRWRRARPAGRPFTVAVNFSARELAHPDVVERVASTLVSTGAAAGELSIEITESTLFEEPSNPAAVLGRLKALGVRVCIDDFGTGYSSLSYLKRFPVDVVKVDRSFVDGLGSDADDAAIVAAVVRMAHALGLGVVAEGIETPEQRLALLELGCGHGQGYLFEAPVAPGALEALLERPLGPSARP
ncbi:MAG: EAL domain-containing protein [Acidimicrobiia bacterium]|nr:EAL domain-containing protein [Acidimicrobiia bacterium]